MRLEIAKFYSDIDIDHSNVSHGQDEGHREVPEKPSEENRDIWESKQSDGGDQVNLKYLYIRPRMSYLFRKAFSLNYRILIIIH